MNKRIIHTVAAFSLSSITFFSFQNCSKTQFTESSAAASSSLDGSPVDQSPVAHAKFFEVSQTSNNKVDILFVIDNSGSMAQEQAKIAEAFSGFISQLSNVDWRIAITTTDHTTDVACKSGNLCLLTSDKYYLDAQTANVNSIFINKIQMGINGSADEVGLKVTQSFLKNKKADYKSFIRSDAALSVIIVSDEDESRLSKEKTVTLTGPANNPKVAGIIKEATTAIGISSQEFLTSIQTLIPSNKKFNVHSSILIPGDTDCKNKGGAVYGQNYYDVSKATNGVVASICDTHYGNQFKMIASSIIGTVGQVNLDCAPSGSISVVRDDGLQINQFTVSGSQVIFSPALETVGKYKVLYSCIPQ